MATDSAVAKRYAAALFDIAERERSVDAVLKDLQLVESYFEQVAYLKSLITQPLVEPDRKRRVLSDAFGDRTTATTLNFLYLLVDKRRANQLDNIIRQYREMVAEKQGRVVAEVQTAVALDNKQLTELQQALAKRTGKRIELKTEIDPTMIAGMRIRLGDTIIDGSVSGRLERVKRQLLGVE